MPFAPHNRLTPHDSSTCLTWLARPRSLESLRANAVAWTDSCAILHPAVVRAAPARIVPVAGIDGYWSRDIHLPQNIDKWTNLSKIFEVSSYLLFRASRQICFVCSVLLVKKFGLTAASQHPCSSRLCRCSHSFSTVLPRLWQHVSACNAENVQVIHM